MHACWNLTYATSCHDEALKGLLQFTNTEVGMAQQEGTGEGDRGHELGDAGQKLLK